MPDIEDLDTPSRPGQGHQWLLDEAELCGVRTTELSAKSLSPDDPDNLSANVSRAVQQGADHIFYVVKVEISATKEDDPVAEINFELLASYHTGDDRPETSFEDLVAFGEIRALPDIYPFARETAQSLASRIGLDGGFIANNLPPFTTSYAGQRQAVRNKDDEVTTA